MSESNWWQDFFLGPYDAVQAGAGDPEKDRRQAAFIAKALELQTGARVLDVPCGGGRIALELAGAGHAVTGLDFNPKALERGKREAERRGLALEWLAGDMRSLPWSAAFDAAFCWFGSFGYFEDAENAAFVREAAKVLKPGGRLLIEGHCVETLLLKYQPRGWSECPGGGRILEDRRWDHERGRVVSEWIFVREGREERQTLSMRIYTYRELAQLFRAAGLEPVAAYDTQSGAAFGAGSARLSLVGRKGA
ncbi:MAG: class I SAM-dependent methyltransferase [Planctomycetota bacterium]|nr:class I SAM-dependent methyltransferase [Planctomycetota bacterium]